MEPIERIFNAPSNAPTGPVVFAEPQAFGTLADLMRATARAVLRAGIVGDLSVGNLSFSAADGEADTCPRRGTVWLNGYQRRISLEGVTLGRDALEALGEKVPPAPVPAPLPVPNPADIALSAALMLAELLGVSVTLTPSEPSEPGGVVLEARLGDRLLRSRPLAMDARFVNLLEPKKG